MLGASDPTGADPTARIGFKNGYFRKNFTDHRLRTAFAYLSRDDLTNEETALVLFSFGGKINEIGPEATAMPQRDPGFKATFQCVWSDERDDAHCLTFPRDRYADFYAETRGVPAPNGVTDGCCIDCPDVDLTDCSINTSGIHWSEIFYEQGHPRLQRIKAAYDPHDVFRHPMSVRPAGAVGEYGYRVPPARAIRLGCNGAWLSTDRCPVSAWWRWPRTGRSSSPCGSSSRTRECP
ncbi:BBE domain-containing protein [Streptomyces sp. bgisy126]|uniref:BBE domain-containing protein n=1 Tax=unclassified Streptomyces TaxID=2593676 RepID=UPI003EB8EA24